MKTKRLHSALIAIGLATCALCNGWAEARTVRATQMSAQQWSKVMTDPDLIVEFRQGDLLPVTFQAQGDLLGTQTVGASQVIVKRNFWLEVKNNTVTMSLDGVSYKPISDVVTGNFTVDGWTGSGPVNAINLTLQAFLK